MLYHVLRHSLTGAALVLGLNFAGALVPAAPAWAQSDETPNGDAAEETSDGDRKADEAPSEEAAPLDTSAPDAESPAGRDGGKAANDAAPANEEATNARDRAGEEPAPGSASKNVAAPAPETPAPARQLATPGKSMDAASGKADEAKPMLDNRGPDYYDRRAAEMLKEDETGASVEPHPLTAVYPNLHIVVCTAGCRDGSSAQIVSMTPKSTPVTDAAPASDRPGLISCVGGCPNGVNGTYIAMPSPAAGGAQIAATVGEWMTTVAKVPDGQAAPQPLASSGSGSGDWMSKINEDRKPAEAAKAPEARAPAPETKAADPKAAEVKVPEATAPEGSKVAVTTPVAAETKAPKAEKAVAAAPASVPVVETPKAAEAAPATDAASDEAKAPEAVQVAAAETKPAPAAEAPKPAAAPKAPEAAQVSEAPSQTAETPDTAPATANDSVKVAAVTPPAEEKKAGDGQDNVMSVHSEDKAMNDAIDKARGSLEAFWKSYDTPGANESDFALKVAIQGDGATEHFWLTRIKREGDKLSGLISNEPQSVKTVKMGQRYEFTAGMISDWTFKRNGKLVGNETMRVLLPRMPEEQAAVYRQMYETP